MEGLTDRQKEVLDLIEAHLRARGYPPTVREIGDRLGFTWPAARGHLRALARKGFVRLAPFRSRGIELAGRAGTPGGGRLLPVAGAIRAGRPVLAVEDVEGRMAVDGELFRDRDAFVLRVSGHSMKEAGILDGDYAVVSPGAEAGDGDIVVALIGDEATVKKLRTGRGRNPSVTLVPCNSAMEPVTYAPGDVSIIGVVKGVVRKL